MPVSSETLTGSAVSAVSSAVFVQPERTPMVAAAEEGYFPKPSQIYHAVIVTMYNETLDVLAPTLDSVVDTTFPKERMILVLAYEERGGEAAEKVAKTLEKNYKKN